MTTVLSAADFRQALHCIAERLAAAESELNALDSPLGDGDCGSNIAVWVRALSREIKSLPDDLGDAVIGLARIFSRNTGSSFNGMMMIGLMRAGASLRGQTEVEVHELGS